MLTSTRPNFLTVWQTFWQTHRPLTLSALITAALTLLFIVGIFADPRVITGAPAWLKPAKFGVSISLYSLTLVWILGLIQGRRRLVNVLGWTVLVTFGLEWIAIITQVTRGTTSHFNIATPLDAALYGLMALAIAVLWGANFVIAGLLLFQKFDHPAFAWSLRLGLMLAVVGMGLGYLMTSPTAQQMAGWSAGGPVTVAGAHTVGVADGGPGLPVVGWSTVGGDLRIPHFVGMHALQLVPFVGWLLSRRRLSPRQQTALVWVISGFYLGLTALFTVQALRGQSVIRPDALQLGLLGGLVAVTVVAVLVVLSGRGFSSALEPAPTRR